MGQWLKKHRVGFALAVLSVVAMVGMFAFSGEKIIAPLRGTWLEPILLALGWTNAIAFNLCIGFLISVFFWWLVVFLPEQQRRRLLRDSVARRYQDFKYGTIQIFSWAANLHLTTAEVEELTDQEKYKEYFKGQRSYDVANGLEANQAYVDGLLMEMQLLADEFNYVLNNVAIQDEEVHRVLKWLPERVYRMKFDPNYTAEPVKYICKFLWEVHTNWIFVSGYVPGDTIKEKLDQL